MATLVQISGLPGTGKTTGLEFLPPSETAVANADKKGLSWAGWKKYYNKENKNYIESSDISMIFKFLKLISDTRPEIKYIAVDTINAIMTDALMLDRKKPSFDQWRQFALDIYELYDMIRTDLREDLIVFCMAHIEPYDDGGMTRWRTKFDGKLLTKSNMSGKINYNLYTEVERSGDKNEYFLVTQTDGRNEARSTRGVLPLKMENNLKQVADLIFEKDINYEQPAISA